ncbi:hypothetical protein TrispH2_011524 [Trichoplax sp. H2]|nr:hypothetical protein TrispH2_011524 [Trichoplax sp. H2]|eukprot:RDD36655.1 hypothetical protein TrispH2_011524 [Trichoplax sp. H2]
MALIANDSFFLTESNMTILSTGQTPSSLFYVINPTLFAISMILLSAGIIGNFFVVLTIIVGKEKCKQIAYYQIGYYAFANVVYCVFFMLLQIMTMKQNQFYQEVYVKMQSNISVLLEMASSSSLHQQLIDSTIRWPYCEVCFSLMFTSTMASTLILAHTSTNWYKTLKNNRKSRVLTPKRLVCKMILIWFAASILSVPYALIIVRTSTNSSLGCRFENYNSPLLLWYALANGLFMGVVPGFTIIYSYGRVIRIFQHNIHALELGIALNRQESEWQIKQHSIVKLLMFVAAVYILFMIPYIVAVVYISVGRQKYFYDPKDDVYLFEFYNIPSTAITILFALNPMIYMAYNQLMKKGFRCSYFLS